MCSSLYTRRAANLSSFAVGTALGWTAPVNPKLDVVSVSPLPAVPTLNEAAWIGSLVALAAFIGKCVFKTIFYMQITQITFCNLYSSINSIFENKITFRSNDFDVQSL